ncbi:class A beta-lactamase-related serine hydrolase [Saxibacter everestensis]|uniref:Class A beta-lactamase-related serine hydrolase n=1 Tax=Saxibacter everestensis TaxID=2909229 RepID=A0ABY8QVV6_9MICO|nr:class A beta-lactamase-related serine hydrolase [Brevibacteriaceae bacterium ZFBP1038]
MPVTGYESDGVPVVSYCLTDFSGRVIAEREPDRTFYAASTVKLGVLIAAMRAVDDGRLDLDQLLTVRHTFRSMAPSGEEFGMDADEIDVGMPPAGSRLCLRDVLWRMVAVSSNEATNMTVELVGFPAIAEAFALCGARSAKMERFICDGPARDHGLTHLMTARDLAAIVRTIVTGAAASEASTAEMLRMLEDQQFDYLARGLPAGIRSGSKSGWVAGIQHDGGYVSPSGHLDADENYVLAVCTRGYAEPDATEMLAAMSRFAYQLQK